MKITLILPRSLDIREIWDRGKLIPNLSLPLLAAYTPKDVEVELVDDQYEPVSFDSDSDLVGITAITETASRAYHLADQYRRRGTPVVLGGIHPTLLPDEAQAHADCVVVGDADEIWAQLIEDFRRDRMKKRYVMRRLPPLAGLPAPRRNLLTNELYFPIEFLYATRGCPRKCAFCSLPNFWGSTFRRRPIDEVVREIEGFHSKLFGFVDDCLDADMRFLKELMQRLIPLRKKWMAEVSLNFCRDQEALKLAAKSGCVAIFVGFETISEPSLRTVGKRQNLKQDYCDLVKRAHDAGIGIEGSFIFGFDGDDRSIFDSTLGFFNKSGLDSINTNILKPYPGTRLYQQLKDQGRMLSNNWADWACCDRVLFKPKLMEPEELLAGVAWVNNQTYSIRKIFWRVLSSLRFKSFVAAHATFHQNMSYRRRKVDYWNHPAYDPAAPERNCAGNHPGNRGDRVVKKTSLQRVGPIPEVVTEPVELRSVTQTLKIELIAAVPKNHRQGLGEKTYRMMFLTLPYLAALAPPEIQVHLTDELVDPVDLKLEADLVGITFMTPFSARGYQLADHFRSRGIPVVIGGPHATILPEEAKDHADAVVVGEAEESWPRLIRDFRQGELKPYYRSSPPSLANLVISRRELLNRRDYNIPDTIFTTRGCPHCCTFCCLPLVFPKTIRNRPVDDVVAELATLPSKFIFIWDDNIIANRAYARELFARLESLGKIWASQSTLQLADDPKLLRLAYRSGCRGMFVGLESFSEASLSEASKSFNRVGAYMEAMKRFHDNGICVQVGIVFGFDHDDPSVFERTVELATKLKVDSIGPSILTPYPNTPLFHRLRSQGRLISTDWSEYDGTHVVFRPQGMSVEQLQHGYHWAQHEFYSLGNIAKRLWGSRTNLIINTTMNLKYKATLARVFPKGANPAGCHRVCSPSKV